MVASSWADQDDILYWKGRAGVLNGKASAGMTGLPCMFGDSITELQSFPYFNAGFASAGVIDLNFNAVPILPALKPSAAVIMIGINDSHCPGINNTLELWEANSNALISEWVGSYDGFIGALLNQTKVVALATILPPEKGYDNDGANRLPVIQMLNGKLALMAAYFKIPLLDTYSAFAGPDGFAQPGFSWDGIHPSQLGYKAIRPLYDSALC